MAGHPSIPATAPARPASARYQKLPGRGRRGTAFFSYGRHRLWLGEDHLLSVDFTVASEEYKRFYFRDIEAWNVRRTATRRNWNWIFALLLAISAGPFVAAWQSQGEGGFLIAAIAFAVFWSVFLLVNSLRGATCQTHLRTAVQLEHLPSLGRLPVTRRVLTRLRPLIAAAQGSTTTEELVSKSWRSDDASRARVPLRPEKGRVHYALFGVLLADAILTFSFHRTLPTIFAASTILTLASFILSLFALMRQSGSDLPKAARVLTIGALVFNLLGFGAGGVLGFIYAVKNPGVQVQTGAEFMSEPGFQTFVLIAGALSGLLGAAGLVAMRAPRQPGAFA